MAITSDLRGGRLVAKVLAGAWRNDVSADLQISAAELEEIAPLLHKSGASSLAWLRVRTSEFKDETSAELFHQAYRLLAVYSEIQEQKLQKLFRLFREASVDVILAKGWAAAGFYPERSLRPFGDFDLYARPAHFKLVEEIVKSPEASDCFVDLHRQFSEIGERSSEELFARSTLTDLGGEQIRTLGLEDHFALLCIHLLKHGAWRPLWLCDIAAAVESLPETFNWDVCAGRTKRSQHWISCAVRLAHELLDASLDRAPAKMKFEEIPPWVVQSVLYQWSNLSDSARLPVQALPLMSTNLKGRRQILRAFLQRWPDPITATFNRKGQFNNLPRAPYQLLDFILLASRYFVHLPEKLRSEN